MPLRSKGPSQTHAFRESSDRALSDDGRLPSNGPRMCFTNAEWRLWFRTLRALKAFAP